MYKKITILYIYMDLVFTVNPKYRVNQKYNVLPQYQGKQNLNGPIVNPRMANKRKMFPNKEAIKKMSCGCGK